LVREIAQARSISRCADSETESIMANGYALAIDIGGTFTDTVLCGADAGIWVDKTLTTHANLLDGMATGIDAVLKAASISAKDVTETVIHATTIVTNAIIERKGANTALLVTSGFRDLLLIRNEWRFDMFDMQLENPEQVVPRDLSFGIHERTLADGTIERAVERAEVENLVEELRKRKVAAVAVCFLNSYANPENERVVEDVFRKKAPEIHVSLSSSIAPQIREYLRASTTAINAYTAPISQPYLDAFTGMLQKRGFRTGRW
jgi:N-methylhydantoinase A